MVPVSTWLKILPFIFMIICEDTDLLRMKFRMSVNIILTILDYIWGPSSDARVPFQWNFFCLKLGTRAYNTVNDKVSCLTHSSASTLHQNVLLISFLVFLIWKPFHLYSEDILNSVRVVLLEHAGLFSVNSS